MSPIPCQDSFTMSPEIQDGLLFVKKIEGKNRTPVRTSQNQQGKRHLPTTERFDFEGLVTPSQESLEH
jgi:hypothetical protein